MFNWQDNTDTTQRITGINSATGRLVATDAASAPLGGVCFAASGSSTGTGAEQTIAHGLGATPDFVYATAIASGSFNCYQATPPDTTNIYPTCSAGIAYKWIVFIIG